jgi:hypothetical protein
VFLGGCSVITLMSRQVHFMCIMSCMILHHHSVAVLATSGVYLYVIIALLLVCTGCIYMSAVDFLPH